jgi:hypothetical protein
MKTTLLRKKLLKGCVSILMVIIVCSCSNALFDQPQPVNEKNLKKIPKALRGIWIDNRDTIIIDKSSYMHVSFLDEHITKAEIDTSKDFKIVNDKLYLTVENPGIKDFQYIQRNDTFFYTARFIDNVFYLSDSVLLRKAEHSFVCSVKRGNWWEIFIIRKKKNGEIQIYYPNENILKENQARFNINLLDTVTNKPQDKLCFHARFNTDFFEKSMNYDVFNLYITLFPNSTFNIEH